MSSTLRDMAIKIGWIIDDEALKKSDRATDKYKRTVQQTENTIGDLGQEVSRIGSRIETDFADMGRSVEHKLKHEVKQAGSEIRELGDDVKSAENDIDRATKNMARDFENVKEKIDSLGIKELLGGLGGGALGANIGSNITSFAQLPREFQASLGSSEKVAENLAQTTKQLWKDIPNITIESAAEAIATANRYFDVTGEKAFEIGKSIALLNQQTGEDIYRLGLSAKLMEDRFADIKSPQMAFRMLTEASQRLPLQVFSELVDQTEEYGGNIAKAGISANDFFSAMIEGGERGYRVMDKLGDSLSTELVAGINKNDEGKLEALKQLSNAKQAEEWRREIVAGGKEGQLAIREILTSLASLDDEQTKAALGAQLLGTMYEEQASELMPIIEKLGQGYAELGRDITELEVRNEGMLNNIKSGWKSLTGEINEITGGLFGEFNELFGQILPWVAGLGAGLISKKIGQGTAKGAAGKLLPELGRPLGNMGGKGILGNLAANPLLAGIGTALAGMHVVGNSKAMKEYTENNDPFADPSAWEAFNMLGGWQKEETAPGKKQDDSTQIPKVEVIVQNIDARGAVPGMEQNIIKAVRNDIKPLIEDSIETYYKRSSRKRPLSIER